ncbi:DUF4468 domain-containing protein [Hyunsoonleella sp. SJ7]|uniref:DUF4468 domain-containing protein n=1 Tax=Hyunsoonleella aquatilis TaxID=2762758 RepID=A0A923H8Q4_9FLAO|nr:DUF4468 domain-containing protein [Hyunsoonleella aquatilis]MBC3759286.1 DUF4468 domain-containing protein [Hyunsoonleella aquatilis]
MRSTFIITFLIFSNASYTQTRFTFTKNGLTPEHVVVQVDSLSETELYSKTLNWIKATYKNPDKVINSKIENHHIQMTSLKENAIKVDKRHLHLRFTIKISFKTGQYKFEPLSIQTKVNSKYDMGWKPFDLKNGAEFFKNGKVIYKTKSYVEVIPEVLNELNSSFYNYLISE